MSTIEKGTPDQIDLIGRWFAMKARMFDQQGTYLLADGTAARINTRSQPLITYKQAMALTDVWIKTASEMRGVLVKAGRYRGRLKDGLEDAITQFMNRKIDWMLYMSSNYGGTTNSTGSSFKGKYLYLPAADKIFVWIGHFVSAMHSATNTALTSKTEWEILGEAIDETPGGFLIKPFYYGVQFTAAAVGAARELIEKIPGAANDVASGIQTLITLTKWASIGGGLYLLYGALKPDEGK
jgi:hypothetical protein